MASDRLKQGVVRGAILATTIGGGLVLSTLAGTAATGQGNRVGQSYYYCGQYEELLKTGCTPITTPPTTPTTVAPTTVAPTTTVVRSTTTMGQTPTTAAPTTTTAVKVNNTAVAAKPVKAAARFTG